MKRWRVLLDAQHEIVDMEPVRDNGGEQPKPNLISATNSAFTSPRLYVSADDELGALAAYLQWKETQCADTV